MKRRLAWAGLILAGAMGCTVFALPPRSDTRTKSTTQSLGRPTREQIAARQQALAQFVADLDHANLPAARAGAQGLVNNPRTPMEAVEGHRRLAMVARHEGNHGAAEQELRSALAALDARPQLEAERPELRAIIVMDQADVAAFGRRDLEGAILLYDRVLAQRHAARPRDLWIASQNAAMLCADLGRFAEATRRADMLRASAFASEIPQGELLNLLASEVSWVAHYDLPGAMERALVFWRQYQDRDEYMVFEVGLQLAHWYPAPLKCHERLTIASALVEKISAVRAAQPSSDRNAPSAAQLGTYWTQSLTVLADSTGCGSPLVPWARQLLGLPAEP